MQSRSIDLEISLVVWNFTGQDRYKTIQPHYMKGVSGFLLLFDLTRSETFKKLPEWIKFIRQNESKDPIILIGSKADLFHLKTVDDADIEKFVNEYKLQGYYEVSFKTGLNVEIVIQKISELIYQYKIENKDLPSTFKLERKDPSRPLILDQQEVLSNYLLTLQTVYKMVFNEIAARIKALKPLSDAIKKTKEEAKIVEFSEEIEKLTNELTEQDKLINSLQENAPIPLIPDQKSSLTEEWTQKRGILLARILLLKEDSPFLNPAQ